MCGERKKTGDTVKSRSSLNQINCNQLQRTAARIASLKIQKGQNREVLTVHSSATFRQHQLSNWL